jgi:hypothetical protein
MQLSNLKRAVGYCRNPGCEEYNNGILLLNHDDEFCCPRCQVLGLYKLEYGTTLNRTSLAFHQVRVEFNYDADCDQFRSIAIVTDESLPKMGGNVYTLKSPLIRTEKRALQVAEGLLGNLMLATEDVFNGSGLGKAKEYVLHFDNSFGLFKTELDILSQELEGSRLRNKT